MAEIDPRYLDTRVVEQYIERGVITREQYQAYLDGLEDVADDGEETKTRFEHLFEFDEEDED